MKITKQRLKDIIKEEISQIREDADDERDAEIEEATRDGKADGAAGEERSPPFSFASRYYNDTFVSSVGKHI